MDPCVPPLSQEIVQDPFDLGNYFSIVGKRLIGCSVIFSCAAGYISSIDDATDSSGARFAGRKYFRADFEKESLRAVSAGMFGFDTVLERLEMTHCVDLNCYSKDCVAGEIVPSSGRNHFVLEEGFALAGDQLADLDDVGELNSFASGFAFVVMEESVDFGGRGFVLRGLNFLHLVEVLVRMDHLYFVSLQSCKLS